MTIETKFNKSALVWFMKDNHPTQGYLTYLKISSGNLVGIKDPLIEWGLARSPSAGPCHELGIYNEDCLFASKEELLKSL